MQVKIVIVDHTTSIEPLSECVGLRARNSVDIDEITDACSCISTKETALDLGGLTGVVGDRETIIVHIRELLVEQRIDSVWDAINFVVRSAKVSAVFAF
jgi:hypothetical protein